MDTLRHSDSIFIGRPPEELYDMIADVTRMGEWSPICAACWWDEGDGPQSAPSSPDSNELPERTWERDRNASRQAGPRVRLGRG